MSNRARTEADAVDSEWLDTVCAALQEVSEDVEGPLRYHDYRASRSESHPSGPLIISHIKWAEACELAGVESGGARDEKTWSPEDCIDAVADAIVDRGGRIASREYSDWCVGRDDVPSTRTVKKRVGSWREAHDRALERLAP